MKRRTLLICGAVALAGMPERRGAVALDLSTLGVDVDTGSLRAYAGSRVRASGFALPHVGSQSNFFVLSGSPSSVCPHCSAGGGATFADLFVYPKAKVSFGAGVWEGKLDVGGLIDPDTGTFSLTRLYEAERVSD